MRHIMLSPAVILLFFSMLQAQVGSWESQTSGTSQWLFGIDFVNASTGWVVGDSGTILKSTTGGVTWVSQSSGTVQQLQAVDFLDASTGFAVGGCDGCADGVILKTTDGGLTWVRKDSGDALNSVQFVSSSTGWAVGSDINANGLILNTTDGGETWSSQVPGVFSFLESVFFIDDTTGWIAGEFPGALLKTTDAGFSWVSETNGIVLGEDIIDVFFIDSQTGWLAGHGFPNDTSTGIIKKTTDGGTTWVNQSSGTDQYLLSLAFVNKDTGWVGGTGGILLKTTNGGAAWVSESTASALEFDKIIARSGEGGWIAGVNGNILRNNFGGLQIKRSISMNKSWNMVCVPLVVSDNSKTSLFPTSSSSAYLYTGAGYQKAESLRLGTGYWLRYNTARDVDIVGLPLDNVTDTLIPGWNMVGGITKDIDVSNVIQNPPNSVKSVYGYGPSGYFPATLIEHGKGYWMRASQNCQVTFRSAANENIPKQYFIDVALLRTDELPPQAPSELAAQQPKKSLPDEYALDQNYPNPFNPSTVIRYSLPAESNVTLKIYDILGEEVRTLVDGVQDAGYQSAEWNATNNNGASLPSGIYICRIQAASLANGKEFFQVRKMLLMK